MQHKSAIGVTGTFQNEVRESALVLSKPVPLCAYFLLEIWLNHSNPGS